MGREYSIGEYEKCILSYRKKKENRKLQAYVGGSYQN
jgi:hypothetical protein